MNNTIKNTSPLTSLKAPSAAKPATDADAEVKAAIASLGHSLHGNGVHAEVPNNDFKAAFTTLTGTSQEESLKLLDKLITWIISTPNAMEAASAIFDDGTSKAGENLFLLKTLILDANSKKTIPGVDALLKKIDETLKKTQNSQSILFSSSQDKHPIAQLEKKLNQAHERAKANSTPKISETTLKNTIQTISNNGDAKNGYSNSCGAIAVYDAFKQENHKAISNFKQFDFARDFKDDTYNKAQKIIQFCTDIEKADTEINNDKDIINLKKKDDDNASETKKILISQPKLLDHEIKTLANETIRYSTNSDQAICSAYAQRKVFAKFPDLIKQVYGDHAVNFVRERLQAKIATLELDIKDKQESLPNIQEASKYNQTCLYKYQSEAALKEAQQLLNKFPEGSKELPQLATEDLFAIYKSTDQCFSPAAIYDIEMLDKKEDKDEINKKKDSFNQKYKTQELSNAQIGIGLAKYGYVFNNASPINGNLNLVTYKHIVDDKQTIKLVSKPGHWEALRIS